MHDSVTKRQGNNVEEVILQTILKTIWNRYKIIDMRYRTLFFCREIERNDNMFLIIGKDLYEI